MNYNLSLIKQEFADVCLELFPENLAFSFLSGSVAYGGGKLGKSDIDIMAVLHASPDSDRLRATDLYTRYARMYVDLNRRHGFLPDLEFPGEVVSLSQVKDAILGRGFSTQNGRVYLPQASDAYYHANSEHWYRAWLSMMAFSVFCAGNYDSFLIHKIAAWKTIILYMLRHLGEVFTEADVIGTLSSGGDKWKGFGVTANYVLFRDHESSSVAEAINRLSDAGYLQHCLNGYVRNTLHITDWEKEIVSAISSNRIARAPYLYTPAEVALVSEKMQKEAV